MRATPLGMRLFARRPVVAAATTQWSAATSGPDWTISGGGLTVTRSTGGSDEIARASSGHSGSGDWWFDVTITATSGNAQVGVANASALASGEFLGQNANSVGWNWNDGAFLGASGSGASGWANGSVLRTRLKNGNLYFALNGTYQNSADPVAETGGIDVSSKGSLFPAVSTAGVWSFVADFTSWA